MDFRKFNKIARITRDMVISEKIDGTNALIAIGEEGEFQIGSRKRWITPEDDNFEFARWAMEHQEELMLLGPGFHYGEWWGLGIQRNYNIGEKRFSLFNTSLVDIPDCVSLVPKLYEGLFSEHVINLELDRLKKAGSRAAPNFMNPEGIVIWHTHARMMFKKTIEGDEYHKGQ